MTSEFLPSREFAYNYTVAMWFAQQFEFNLRAIIHTLEYNEWIGELPLKVEQKDRFKTPEQFIDKATLGLLIETLEKAGVVKSKSPGAEKKLWKMLNDVCPARNRLAHEYLAEHDFGKMTSEQCEKAIREIKRMALFFNLALKWSQTTRETLERMSDEQNKKTNEVLGFPINWDSPTRKYVMRKHRVPPPKKT